MAGSALNFRAGHPTVVNRFLIDGAVSVAPCSSVCLLKNGTEMALPLGVASNAAVQSVYLGLAKETPSDLSEELRRRIVIIRDIFAQATEQFGDSYRRIGRFIWDAVDSLPPLKCESQVRLKLTTNSASSVVLSKVFYQLMFGRNAYDAHVANALPGANPGFVTMELVIGDDALVRRSEFAKVIDLGQFWQSVTGRPFVFAVWQKCAKSLTSSWAARINEAAEIAQARMHVEPSVYFPKAIPMNYEGQEIDLGGYWRGIHYRLGPKDIGGLLLFLSLAKQMLRADLDEAMIIKMLRWQQMSDNTRTAFA